MADQPELLSLPNDLSFELSVTEHIVSQLRFEGRYTTGHPQDRDITRRALLLALEEARVVFIPTADRHFISNIYENPPSYITNAIKTRINIKKIK